MKVVLLTNDSIQARALEILIVNKGINLTKVIRVKSINKQVKKGSPLKFAITKLGVKLGALKNKIFQDSKTKAALNFEQECCDFFNKKLSFYIESKLRGQPETHVKSVEVFNVNSEEVIAELRQESPDICVVFGTPILKKGVLQECKIFLNAHTSILPYYKGTRSEFWQCYEGNQNTVGVTFHKIDDGVDTGAIFEQIYQEKITLFEPYCLRYHNTILILENYPKVIQSVISGSAILTSQSRKENLKTYKFVDITIDKRVELYSKLLLTKPKLY